MKRDIPNLFPQQPAWWWSDMIFGDPAWEASLRSALISFVAIGNGEPAFIGTGVVVARIEELECLVAITAKHVFEHALRVQRPHPRSSLSALPDFMPKSQSIPSIDPRKLKALWMGQVSCDMMDVKWVQYPDSADIAVCILAPQEHAKGTIKSHVVPLDLTTPSVGDPVNLVSLSDMKLNVEADDQPDTLVTMYRRTTLRSGSVTAVYPKGRLDKPWPCFTTSIPAEPGMSGGFVYRAVPDVTVAACGIICADASEERAAKSFEYRGESVITCSWLALALQLPRSTRPSDGTDTIYGMMSRGVMQKALGGFERFRLVQVGPDDYLVSYS